MAVKTLGCPKRKRKRTYMTESEVELTHSQVEDLDDFLDYMISESKKRLEKFRSEFNMEFDYLSSNNLPVPEWFPNPSLYRPLFEKYSQSFQELKLVHDKLKAAISQVKEEMSQIKEVPNDDEKEIEMLRKKQEQLISQRREMERICMANTQSKDIYDSQIASKETKLQHLSKAIQELLQQRQKYILNLNELIKTIEEIAQENNAISKKLKSSSNDIHKLEDFLKQCRLDTERIQQERDKNFQKNEALTQQMKSLSIECAESKNKIEHLKSQIKDHSQMSSALELAKKQLENEKSIETSILNKLNDALNKAESSKTSAERLKMESESLRNEVDQAKQNLNETLQTLKENAQKKIETINKGYESKIIEMNQKFTQLLDENSNLSATLNSLKRQLSFLETQNNILRNDDGRSKISFDEFTRGAKNQLEMLQNQIEELTREAQRMKEKEQKQKSKLESTEIENDKLLSSIKSNVDKLETDLSRIKSSISEAEAQNAALIAENNRLTNELTRVSANSKNDIEMKIAEKDNEIYNLTIKLDEMRRNHILQTGELQKVLIENKRYADKWKDAAENLAIESENGIQQTEENKNKLLQRIELMKMEIEKQEADAASLQELIAKRQQQARDLQAKYEEIEQRVFDQKTQIDLLYEQQMQYANKKEEIENKIDEKKTELRRIKRQMELLKKL